MGLKVDSNDVPCLVQNIYYVSWNGELEIRYVNGARRKTNSSLLTPHISLVDICKDTTYLDTLYQRAEDSANRDWKKYMKEWGLLRGST